MTTSTLVRTGPHRTAPHPISESVPTIAEPGWHADPMRLHKLRWHDGTEWTGHVTHFGPVPCLHCGA